MDYELEKRSLTYWENEKQDLQIVVKTISQGQLKVYETTVFFFLKRRHVRAKVGKGVWRMPWLLQAMKDVISCDKPRVGANDL